MYYRLCVLHTMYDIVGLTMGLDSMSTTHTAYIPVDTASMVFLLGDVYMFIWYFSLESYWKIQIN